MRTHKMHRSEAEIAVACATASVANGVNDFNSRFIGMFAKQYDPNVERRSNGQTRGYTYPAKKLVDIAVQEGVVDDDGVDVGLILEPVTK